MKLLRGACASWAEACQGVSVQVEVVAAGKPDHQVTALGIKSKAQCTPPQRQVFDLAHKVQVVAVTFTATLAAAFQPITAAKN